jgi:hypothetical protein
MTRQYPHSVDCSVSIQHPTQENTHSRMRDAHYRNGGICIDKDLSRSCNVHHLQSEADGLFCVWLDSIGVCGDGLGLG